MFKWLKGRGAKPAVKKASSRPARPRPPAAPPMDPGHSIPSHLPEVVGEGNTQADWSAWEDSMTALDSQLPDLAPSSRVQVRDTRPSQLDDLDPFSGVRKKRDV
jgi:hypothetical protein